MGSSAIEGVPALGGGGGGAVTSVATRTGDVVLTAADVGAGQLPSGVLLPSGIVIPSSADISGILGSSGSKAAAGNDSRLSDARTPTAHASSHQPGGSDAMAVDQAAATASLRSLGLTGSKAMPGTATLDQITAPAAAVPMNSQKITGLANGSSAQDAAAFGQIPLPGAVGGPPKIARRTSDGTGITANTTLANDSQLLLAVAANDVWYFQAWLLINAANATMDAKLGFSVPVSCTMTWGAASALSGAIPNFTPNAVAASPAAMLTESGVLTFGSAALTFGVSLAGIITNGANAGNVNLQAAQNTSDAGALVMKANSLILAWRVA